MSQITNITGPRIVFHINYFWATFITTDQVIEIPTNVDNNLPYYLFM